MAYGSCSSRCEADHGDRDAIHVLIRETETLEAILATLEQVRDHLVVQVREPKTK
jgi:hypothetical protein